MTDQTFDPVKFEENQRNCTKLLTDLFEVKKVKKLIDIDTKRNVNIGKLLKSVANCYDCKVSKFDDNEKVTSEDEIAENEEIEENYYEIELISKTNKLIITDKRTGKKYEICVTEFRSFLENKLDLKTEGNSDNETNDPDESLEDKKFHFLKFELILREFYQKNEIRATLKNNYKSNDEIKNLGLSFAKQPMAANTYQGKKNVYASPAIKKNFFEDHKEEIKNISKRRKTMYMGNCNFDQNFDKLQHDLEDKKANSQVPKFNVFISDVKNDKVSSFVDNFED